MNTEYKTNRHSCYSLKYHLVVVTKYRHKCINKEVMNRLIEISNNIFDKWNCSILEINGEADHLHILFEAPPQVQLSKLINNFKTVSSRLIRKDFAEYLSKFYSGPYFWSESYLVLSAGDNAISDIVKQYIQSQAALQE